MKYALQVLTRSLCAISSACVLAGALASCDIVDKPPRIPQDIPRPVDYAWGQWLDGQRITYKKGLLSDAVWTIEAWQISGLKVESLTKDPRSEIISASLSFRVTAAGKGIQVDEAMVRYIKTKDGLTFFDFIPVSYSPIGN